MTDAGSLHEASSSANIARLIIAGSILFADLACAGSSGFTLVDYSDQTVYNYG